MLANTNTASKLESNDNNSFRTDYLPAGGSGKHAINVHSTLLLPVHVHVLQSEGNDWPAK